MSAPGPASLADVFTRSPAMVGRAILDDFLLVPIVDRAADAEAIYDLNPVGAYIWERFDGVRDGRAIVADIAGRYDVEPERAARDYLDFVLKLLSIGALAKADGPREPTGGAG